MKHLKTFEGKTLGQKNQDNLEIFQDVYYKNPAKKTHDFYMFIGRYKYEEAKGGMFKRKLEIENMVKITPDMQSMGAMQGLQMRARFQNDSTLYHIWLPKEIENEVSGKSSDNIDDWLVKLIDEHKQSGGDEYGKQAVRDSVKKKKETDDIIKDIEKDTGGFGL